MDEFNVFDEKVIPDYGKINALGSPYLKDLLLDPVLIQEKVDGSQFSFGILDGVLRCRSSGCEIFMEAPDKMFRLGVEYVKTIQDKLVPGWIYRSEYLCKPKHSSLAYARIPNNHLALFDVMVGYQRFLPYEGLPGVAEDLDIEAVPAFEFGMLDLEKFQEFMSRESFLGGQQIEGVVVKNYHRFSEQTGKVLMGKYVTEKFKEVHRKEWGEANPGRRDIILRIIDSYKTPARWEKAVYRLREQGKIEDSPRDIGHLVKSVWPDIVLECEDEIKQMLWKAFEGDISRGCVKGLAQWYKERLLHEQFERESNGTNDNSEQDT